MSDGGVFRGNREPKADYFDDVMGDNRVPAMFQTDMGGLSEYEDVRTQATPEGLLITMHCRPPGCGHPKQAVISWGELFVVANAPQTGILPVDWRYSEANHAPCPTLRCSCGQPFEPIITVDWAQKQVNLALQGGLISEQQLRIDPQVQRVYAAMQQRQGQQMQGPPRGYRG